ncbi:GNAT family N-acetyltransferase [Actinoplanes couchii]|uniref:N-acetyltransferase n=1 Tax=Actinoplanes couchii TaxID=403638 RepID=A0ABQ3XC75_9ACTN|nr:GNAT family protein [Actinoplanes couchii]MDR6323567.1 RimJ/RimL family protein N-acetyltransferase [Actinoplanes couchii]GID56084.1 N-acetyltransferase [Actinoplanes couchii]
MRWRPWSPNTGRSHRSASPARRIPRRRGNTFPDLDIRTSRLLLRELRETDVPEVVAGASDEVTQRWLPLPWPYTEHHATMFVTRLAPAMRVSGHGTVRALEYDGNFAGVIDLKRTDWTARVTEIGYWTMPGFRGLGLTTEAASAITRWALADLGFERVELRVPPENRASNRVAVKSGFALEGILRNAGQIRAGRVDLAVYSRIRADLTE